MDPGECGSSAGPGLAPVASVEDLSDEQEQEQESPGAGERHRLTLPGVREESGAKSPRMGVPTPRIDISRASSSSHQDDSSPERDLFTGGAEGVPVAKLGLGFTEEMAQELRNSTEELDFQDPTDIETKQRRRKLHQQQAVNKYELEMQGEKEGGERKDSACSDTGLLYISGRTSRLSSIGSAASGGSAASHASGASHLSAASHFSGVSHISGASHLSAASQLSRASRCSSPHKMLLETSFCGPKPIPTVSLEAEYPPKESVEATLLARKTDPTGAVLPIEEHKNMVNGKTSIKSQPKEKLKATKSASSTLTVGREPSLKSKSSERSAKSHSGREVRSSSFHSKTSRTKEAVEGNVEVTVQVKTEDEKTTPHHRKEPPRLPPGSNARFISLHDDDEQPVSVSKSKSKTLPLDSGSRIISLHGDDEPPVKSESKKTFPVDSDSKFISLHSDEPQQPIKAPVVSTSKRKTPSKESSTKTLPVRKTESKSAPVGTSRRKQPIKYEGDQIFIPLTGDETPIVLRGGNRPTTALDGDSRIIPLHGSPEEPIGTGTASKKLESTPLDKDSRIIPLKGDEIEIHTTTRQSKDGNQKQQPRVVHAKKKPTIPPDASAVIIPLHGDEEIVALEIETDRPSSPEYGIYIPLKGPEIADYSKKAQLEMKPKVKQETISKPTKLDVKPRGKTSKTSPSVESKQGKKKEEELVKFISLHADESERQPLKIEVTEEFVDEKYDLKVNEFRSKSASPVCQAEIQSIQHTYFKPDDSSAYSRKHSTSSCRSPEFEGAKVKPATLDLTQIVRPSRPVQSLTQLTRDESRTPSPATSMSRGSLFRRSSESSSSTKSRASVSSEFKSRKDSKNKSVFSSLFKKGSRDSLRRKSESSEKTTPMDPRLTKVEFTFNQQDRGREGDTIIIPLHSPDSVPAPLVLAADMPPEVDIHIHPPELTAETVQSISEVVAAIEELKSQPLDSPVPTPTSSSSKKTEEAVVEATQPEPEIDVETQKTEEKLELEEPKVEETVEIRPKRILEVIPSLEADISPRSETSGGSTKTQLEAPLEKQESDKKSDTETVKTGSEERRSSESEPDSDAVSVPRDLGTEDDHERKGLFHQGESLEDELPYVPTTLPQERPVAHPIIPVKQRVAEVKTYPIDRPRSTTPINPTSLDDYVSSPHEETAAGSREKMQIVLPRTESLRENRSKSPHRPAAKPWTHFAEQGLQSPRELRRVASPSPPPPLPPRATASWVCFDEVPERRRTPKRITTLPSSQPAASGVVYSYVNPEECSCECHEAQGRVNGAQCSDSGAHCQYKDQYRT